MDLVAINASTKQQMIEDPSHGGWIRSDTMVVLGSGIQFQKKLHQV